MPVGGCLGLIGVHAGWTYAGHSLGGAVAALSTLRLLRQLPSGHQPRVKCICFGSPAVGNAALAQLVARSGWEMLFHSVVLPGDLEPYGCSFGRICEATARTAQSSHTTLMVSRCTGRLTRLPSQLHSQNAMFGWHGCPSFTQNAG